ncbi:MAG: SPOR domain-containing protein [bacterium]|nr:SPOR domain-containing protein [bacterium]
MKYLFLFISLTLLAGCGTSTSSEEHSGEIIDPYADPPGYTGDPFAGFGEVNTIEFPATGSISVEAVTATVINGSWSVQLAACASLDAALSLRDVVAASTEQPVFIDHMGSYYKVRVGAFLTSSDSDELRIHYRSNGYPDAWSVERSTTP